MIQGEELDRSDYQSAGVQHENVSNSPMADGFQLLASNLLLQRLGIQPGWFLPFKFQSLLTYIWQNGQRRNEISELRMFSVLADSWIHLWARHRHPWQLASLLHGDGRHHGQPDEDPRLWIPLEIRQRIHVTGRVSHLVFHKVHLLSKNQNPPE